MANNILGPLGAAQHMQNQFERGQQAGQERFERRLGGEIMGGDPAAYAKLAAQNPDAAAKYQKADDSQVLRMEGLINYMKGIEAQNPQAAQAAWVAHGVPYVRQFANGTEPTQDWAQAKTMLATLEGRIAMAKAGHDGEDMPTGFREAHLKAVAAGYQPGTQEYQRAMKISLGTEAGLARTQPKTITTDINGVPTTLTFDPGTQSYRVAVIDGAGPPPVPMPGPAPAPAGQPTYTAQAGDETSTIEQEIGRPLTQTERASIAAGTFRLDVPAQGGVQTAPQAAQAPPQATGVPIVGRTKEAEAAAVAEAQKRAEANVQFETFPRMTELEAEREAAKTRAHTTAEQQAEAAAAAPQIIATADEAISLVDQLLAHPGRRAVTGLSGVIDPRNLIPGTPAYDFKVMLDQAKGKAFLQAFQSLRGGGAITEREGKAATDAIARLQTAQSDPAFEQALKDFKAAIERGREATRRRAQGGAGTGGAGAPRQRATNPQTGEVLELVNGQWVPAQ